MRLYYLGILPVEVADKDVPLLFAPTDGWFRAEGEGKRPLEVDPILSELLLDHVPEAAKLEVCTAIPVDMWECAAEYGAQRGSKYLRRMNAKFTAGVCGGIILPWMRRVLRKTPGFYSEHFLLSSLVRVGREGTAFECTALYLWLSEYGEEFAEECPNVERTLEQWLYERETLEQNQERLDELRREGKYIYKHTPPELRERAS